MAEDFLETAADRAEGDPVQVSVRELLRVFDAKRRGYKVLNRVRRRLKERGLQAEPDINGGPIDKLVSLVPMSADSSDQQDEPIEVGIKVRDIPSATGGVEHVSPQDTLDLARTRMTLNDYSQLPVLSDARQLRGVVSWESIGRAEVVYDLPLNLGDATQTEFRLVSADDDLLPLLSEIADHGYVFVQEKDRKIAGIVTPSDVTRLIDDLTQPFLLIGELERSLRVLAQRHFKLEELQSLKDPDDYGRTVESIDDLSLGEFVRLFENPANWSRLGWRMDRVQFIESLRAVRDLRNDLMHFSPDPPSTEDLQAVRNLTTAVRAAIAKPDSPR